MSGLKTFQAITAILILLSLAVPARLTARPLDPLTAEFAACTGRLSALMEHQWLLSDPEADRTKARRAAMIALMEAAMPTDAAPAALARRIEAKHAQAVLLTRATFGTGGAQARWAAARAEAEISRCIANLLG